MQPKPKSNGRRRKPNVSLPFRIAIHIVASKAAVSVCLCVHRKQNDDGNKIVVHTSFTTNSSTTMYAGSLTPYTLAAIGTAQSQSADDGDVDDEENERKKMRAL